jgi:hypothetical protein
MKIKILKVSDTSFLKMNEIYDAQFFGDKRIIFVKENNTVGSELSPNDILMLTEWEHEWFEFV